MLGLGLRRCGPNSQRPRLQGVGESGALRGGIIDGGGQQLSREVVSTFRQDHRQLSAGSCVQLGGTPGAGASALGEPLEADVEQAFLGELVEVELRSMTSDAEGVRGLVSTDWRGLGAHVQVEVAPDRVGERRNAGHTRRKIVSVMNAVSSKGQIS